MSDLNNYSFTGRLGADAEVRTTASGTAIWSARVAVGYGYGDNKGTNWVTAKSFGKRAEGLAKLGLTKGTHIAVSGELQMREYDRKDGTKGLAVEVNADSINLLGGRDKGQEQGQQPTRAPVSSGGGMDEDVPFSPVSYYAI